MPGYFGWFTRRRWRMRLRSWVAAEIVPLLWSSMGDDRLQSVSDELSRRLRRPLLMLFMGSAALDERLFGQQLHYALAWLAGQEDVLLRGETLRAFCDVSTSVAALDRITLRIAAELR